MRCRTAGIDPPGFAGDHDAPNVQRGHVDLVLGAHFGQVQGVAGRAEHGRRARPRAKSSRARAAHRSGGNHHGPRAATASKALQNPMNGPNENAISARSCGPISAASSTNCQVSIHQFQSSSVSSTTKRPAARARCAVIADVAVDRKGQIGRVIAAVARLLQFVLERERQLIQLIQRRERQAHVGQFLGVKPIVRQDSRQQSVETRQLVCSEFTVVQDARVVAVLRRKCVSCVHHTACRGRGKPEWRAPDPGFPRRAHGVRYCTSAWPVCHCWAAFRRHWRRHLAWDERLPELLRASHPSRECNRQTFDAAARFPVRHLSDRLHRPARVRHRAALAADLRRAVCHAARTTRRRRPVGWSVC